MNTVKGHQDVSCINEMQRKEQTFYVLTDQQHLQNFVQFCVTQFKRNISKMILRKVNGLKIRLETLA